MTTNEIDKFINSKEGKDYFEKIAEKEKIKYKRTQKLKNYLDNKDFGEFIGRIIKEHDDNYIDKCYKKGCEPYPNNKLYLLLKLVEIEGEPINNIDFKDINFPNEVIKYKGYYFQWIWGQGVIIKIYNEEYENILQI